MPREHSALRLQAYIWFLEFPKEEWEAEPSVIRTSHDALSAFLIFLLCIRCRHPLWTNVFVFVGISFPSCNPLLQRLRLCNISESHEVKIFTVNQTLCLIKAPDELCRCCEVTLRSLSMVYKARNGLTSKGFIQRCGDRKVDSVFALSAERVQSPSQPSINHSEPKPKPFPIHRFFFFSSKEYHSM